MYEKLIEQRLKKYEIVTENQEENALKEIMQEIVLYALSQTGFFEKAAFHGGTSLRILHGLRRFSEDLDFLLQEADMSFRWGKFQKELEMTLRGFGVDVQIRERESLGAIQNFMLKDNSLGKLLILTPPHHKGKALKIKLEIDSNPPMGSKFEVGFVDFPVPHGVVGQDLSSNFALKCHALLCRGYLKGRDWYDFSWYVAESVKPNLQLLQNTLQQQGPWKGENIFVTPDWLVKTLREKIAQIEWKVAAADVRRFVGAIDLPFVDAWNTPLFLKIVTKFETKVLETRKNDDQSLI